MAAKVYVCDNCGFMFIRTGECEQCPDCGKKTVREASPEEKEEFAERQKEYRTRLFVRIIQDILRQRIVDINGGERLPFSVIISVSIDAYIHMNRT